MIGALLLSSALAADLPPELVAQQRYESQAMGVLLGWSVAGLSADGAGWLLEDDLRARSFHRTNVAWNSVNLGIAGLSLVAQQRRDWAALDLAPHQVKLERTFWVNAGLDLLYITAGSLLWQRGLNVDRPDFVGSGQSIALQGGFLLAFDTSAALRQRALR